MVDEVGLADRRVKNMGRIFAIMKYLRRWRYALTEMALLFYASVPASAQETKNPDSGPQEAIITKLFPLTYPPLARQTRITGNVELRLDVRPDGSVASAVAISGHPLLKQPALENAQRSQFACIDCAEEVHSYRLVYTFELGPASGCFDQVQRSSSNPEQPYPRISQSPGRVTIIDQPWVTCDAAGTITYNKARSIKCMYLWKCAKPRVIFIE